MYLHFYKKLFPFPPAAIPCAHKTHPIHIGLIEPTKTYPYISMIGAFDHVPTSYNWFKLIFNEENFIVVQGVH